MTLQVNFFNLFNHPNFRNPVGDINNSAFGRSRSTFDPRITRLVLRIDLLVWEANLWGGESNLSSPIYFALGQPAFTSLACELMGCLFVLRSRKLCLDNSFKRGLRLGPSQEDSVDEESRSAAHSRPDSLLEVFFNLCLVLGTG